MVITPLVREVLGLFLGAPEESRIGYQVMIETGKPGGTVYPLLRRLEAEGLLEGTDEPSPNPRRPPRRSYVLTTAGLERARSLAD
jgi:DNA-binding PadR family transcriptional regulator